MYITELENKGTKFVLTEMCRRVGADPAQVDVKKENWFREYTWTEEEQDDFAYWFDEELAKPKSPARETVDMKSMLKSPRQRKKAIDWFLLNYGWMTKSKG